MQCGLAPGRQGYVSSVIESSENLVFWQLACLLHPAFAGQHLLNILTPVVGEQ